MRLRRSLRSLFFFAPLVSKRKAAKEFSLFNSLKSHTKNKTPPDPKDQDARCAVPPDFIRDGESLPTYALSHNGGHRCKLQGQGPLFTRTAQKRPSIFFPRGLAPTAPSLRVPKIYSSFSTRLEKYTTNFCECQHQTNKFLSFRI